MQQRNSSIIKSSKRIDQNKFSKAGCSLNKNTKKKTTKKQLYFDENNAENKNKPKEL